MEKSVADESVHNSENMLWLKDMVIWHSLHSKSILRKFCFKCVFLFRDMFMFLTKTNAALTNILGIIQKFNMIKYKKKCKSKYYIMIGNLAYWWRK